MRARAGFLTVGRNTTGFRTTGVLTHKVDFSCPVTTKVCTACSCAESLRRRRYTCWFSMTFCTAFFIPFALCIDRLVLIYYIHIMRSVATGSPGISIIVQAILLTMVLLFAVDVVEVQGLSMLAALKDRQTVIVNRAAYGLQLPFFDRYLIRWGAPRRDEIVIYDSPLDGLPVIKRCIGVEGDRVIVDGIEVNIGGKKYNLPTGGVYVAGTIPADRFFMVGDNSAYSIDSRHYGYIDISAVRGRIRAR